MPRDIDASVGRPCSALEVMRLNLKQVAIGIQPSQSQQHTYVAVFHETSCRNISVTYTLYVICQVPFAFDLTAAMPLKLVNCRDQQTAAPAHQPGPPQQAPVAYVSPTSTAWSTS